MALPTIRRRSFTTSPRAWGHQAPLRIIHHPQNAGLTATLRTGFFAATTECVTWIPADGQIPLSELAKILQAYRGEICFCRRIAIDPTAFCGW